MTPTCKHVVRAYAVYRDPGLRFNDNYMLMTQFCEGYDNVYNLIAGLRVESLS